MTLNVELLDTCLAWVTPAQAASLFWASNSLQEGQAEEASGHRGTAVLGMLA